MQTYIFLHINSTINMQPVKVDVHLMVTQYQTHSVSSPEAKFNIKMHSHKYGNSHCWEKMILQPTCPHNGLPHSQDVILIRVRSHNCGCLVTWFCYQLIAKPGNKTAEVSWPDPYWNGNQTHLNTNMSSYQYRHSHLKIRWPRQNQNINRDYELTKDTSYLALMGEL